MNLLRNVRIMVDGQELNAVSVDLVLPSSDADLERSVFGAGNLEISGRCELSVPADLEKLRSVSPAAKKVFARDRVARFIRELGGEALERAERETAAKEPNKWTG